MSSPPEDPKPGIPPVASPSAGTLPAVSPSVDLRSAASSDVLPSAPACVTLPERVADVPALDRGPLTGRLIQGRYLIKGLIGEGGMGVVYRAEHTLMGKELAIKVLLPEYSQVESIARRFQQEAQSASRLEHPGIIQVFDFGSTEEGHLFLAMSLLAGQSLTDVIRRDAPLAPARAIAIAAQIGEALHHAHSEGVVHRDMKPDNVMLIPREKGELVKLLDFGIARVTEGEGAAKGMTELGMVFGTPEYLSPEQAVGDPADARSDLYALGVILYEMLTGKRPFEASTAAGHMQAHLNQPPPRFGQRVPGLVLPPALENVTLRALAKAPADRFQSGQVFADTLRSLQLAPFALPAAALVSVPGIAALPGPGAVPVVMAVPGAAAISGAALEPGSAVSPGVVAVPGAAEVLGAAATAPTAPAIAEAAVLADAGASVRPPAESAGAIPAQGVAGQGPAAVGNSAPAQDRAARASRAASAYHESPALSHAVKVWGLVALGLVLFLLVVLLAVIAGSDGEGRKEAGDETATGRKDASVLNETLELATLLPDAERLLAEKKWSEAEAKLQPMLSRWPRDPRIHLLLGHLHRGRGNVQACLGSYQTALLLEPSLRENAALLDGLAALLGSKTGPGEGRAMRDAAVAFAVGPFATGTPLGSAARRMLSTWANHSLEHDLVWRVVALLEGQKALEGVDLVRAYRLRFQSVEGCEERRRFIDEIVGRKDDRLVKLLQELHREPHLSAPRGEGKISNECLREATEKAILALGGALPGEPGEPGEPRAPPRRRRR